MQRTLSRRPVTTLVPSRARWLGLLVLACLLSACAGGSGSSGFDALLAENNAIQKALDSDSCEVVEGLTICAAGAAAPSPTGTATVPQRPTRTSIPPPPATPTATARPTSTTTAPTPAGLTATPTIHSLTQTPTGTPPALRTPTATTTLAPPTASETEAPAPSLTATPEAVPTDSASPTPTATPVPGQPGLDTNLTATDALPCQPDGPAATCTFLFTFRPIGLPASTVYRVALRSRNPDGNWEIMEAPGNSVALELSTSPPGVEYQIAVLAFAQDPGALPATVELLGDTGADIAFVTQLLRPQP